jgi:hypothetical protein
LNRNISAATGVTANAAPASSAALGPLIRRTAAYSNATVATPINASGISIEALLNPKSCPESPIAHCDTGGLSTIMKFCVSSEPNSNASQFFDPA